MDRIALVALLLLTALLAGCGFQLRGAIDLPPAWEELHLSSVSPNSELSRALRDRAERAGVHWRERDEANFIIRLGNERFERRNLTIGDNARAAEFELQMTASLGVTDSAGRELMPATDVSIFRVFANDPQNIAGTADEARLTRDEMRQELAQQMLRKLRFLATTTPGDAD